MRPDQRLAALIAAEAGGCPPADFLFFWGHRPQRDGSVGPGCLSQWWPSPFAVDHVIYPTAEHWMMAGKADRKSTRLNSSHQIISYAVFFFKKKKKHSVLLGHTRS